jgi:hypothetical protein
MVPYGYCVEGVSPCMRFNRQVNGHHRMSSDDGMYGWLKSEANASANSQTCLVGGGASRLAGCCVLPPRPPAMADHCGHFDSVCRLHTRDHPL